MKRLLFILLIVVAAGMAGAYFVLQNTKWQFGDGFTKVPTALVPYDIYDIGAAKVDSDDSLDVYTVNHSSRQQVLFGSGESAFMSDIGLGQVSGFPGAEAKPDAPLINQPGLHIYRKGKNLHIVTHQLDKLGLQPPFQISLELPWRIVVVSSKNTKTTLLQREPAPSAVLDALPEQSVYKLISVADITLEENSEIVITGDQDILELPHTIKVLNEGLRNNAFIGGKKTGLRSSIELLWRDRHAMLWRDIDNDNDSDVFIARGGVKGQLATVPTRIVDEFLVRQGNRVGDIVELAGMQKHSCPSRQSAWTDANADGVLDVHISCGRVAFENAHPDQIYVENAGRYRNIAKELGLDYEGVSVFKWADFDMDGDLDLFTAQSQSLLLYTNNGGDFSKTMLRGVLLSKPTQIVVADLDHDADLDVLVVQRSGSLALLNTDSSFSIQAPEILGLPSELRAASIVDFDNDGYTDLHLVPGGLYRAVSAGKYEQSAQLTDSTKMNEISEARCVWVDQDMNGLLDPTCAVRLNPHKLIRAWKKGVQKQTDTRYWVTYAAKNATSSVNNWIHLDLEAGSLNAEGIGAVVSLTANGRTQVAFVGQSDSAHFSQGHYRLYFGLGSSTTVDELTVHWPGGNKVVYPVTEVNTLLKLSQSPATN